MTFGDNRSLSSGLCGARPRSLESSPNRDHPGDWCIATPGSSKGEYPHGKHS